MEFLNGDNVISKVMGYIEAKTRIPHTFQFCIFVTALAVWLAFGHGAALLCNLIAFIYPAYKSIQAIETAAKEDDTQWLMYWTVFGSFTCLDYLLLNLVGQLPFYYLLKSIFLIWCYLPIEYNGSTVLYNRVVLGLFIRYHQEIDEMIGAAGRQTAVAVEMLAKKGKVVAEVGKDVTAKLAKSGKETATKMAEAGQKAMSKAAKNGKETATKMAEAGQKAMTKAAQNGREVIAKVGSTGSQSSADEEEDVPKN